MKALSVGLLAVLMSASLSLAGTIDSNDSYLQVRLMKQEGTAWGYFGATSTSECSGGQTACDVFYIGRTEFGTKSGIVVPERDVLFEMPYSLTVAELLDENLLLGVVFALNLANDKDIVSGKKNLVRQPIEFDREVVIEVGQMLDSSTFGLGVTLTGSLEPRKQDHAPIRVITAMMYNGEGRGWANNAKWSLEAETTFRTGTGYRDEDDRRNQIKYEVRIEMSDLPERIDRPVRTELSFHRTYLIDTAFIDMSSFSGDLTYSSVYRKEIELTPDQELILVFPPDTPSVYGFDFEDTLIIKP
jgi:hypothetical protein